MEAAREAVAEQAARLRADERVRIGPPDPGVPAGRRLAELHHAGGVHTIAGPERVAITGPNGIGKTLLLETLFDGRLDGLDPTASALDSVWSAAPGTPPGTVRAQLARFVIRGEDADRPVATLSGGERFRVALARLLLAEPPHQVLVLDEPTNNLDLKTTQALVDALSGYRGALLIVSHDEHLLGQIGLDAWFRLNEAGALISTT